MRILVVFMILFISFVEPVINPDNVRPGEWFIVKVETQRERDCRILYERTGLICEQKNMAR